MGAGGRHSKTVHAYVRNQGYWFAQARFKKGQTSTPPEE